MSRKKDQLSLFGRALCFNKWPKNCNGTQQIHNRVVCLDKDRKITVSPGKFPLFNKIVFAKSMLTPKT